MQQQTAEQTKLMNQRLSALTGQLPNVKNPNNNETGPASLTHGGKPFRAVAIAKQKDKRMSKTRSRRKKQMCTRRGPQNLNWNRSENVLINNDDMVSLFRTAKW